MIFHTSGFLTYDDTQLVVPLRSLMPDPWHLVGYTTVLGLVMDWGWAGHHPIIERVRGSSHGS